MADDLSDPGSDELIRLQTDMFAEMLFLSTAAMFGDDVDSGAMERQASLHEDVIEGRLRSIEETDGAATEGGSRTLRSTPSFQDNSTLPPELKEECKTLAMKLDKVASELNDKYVSIAQEKVAQASSYTDFESAIYEAFRNSDHTANQVALLFRLTRDAAVGSWNSASTLMSWGTQFFQQRIAKQVVQDHKTLKSCVENAAATG